MSEPYGHCHNFLGLGDDSQDGKMACFAARHPLAEVRAMRAIGVATRVEGQRQQQLKSFDVKIAELGVAVKDKHASIPSPEIKEHQGVGNARVPPIEDTCSVSVNAGAAMEEQELESDEFSKVERHRSVSPEFVVKLKEAMAQMVDAAQAIDVEDDVVSVMVKGDEGR